jgi:rapamycin-insensitive companion of mTOR
MVLDTNTSDMVGNKCFFCFQAEGGKLLNELLADIWLQIDAITSSKSAHDCLFSPQHVSNSLCQNYFMFIGRLCRCSKGLRMLDKAGIFQQ